MPFKRSSQLSYSPIVDIIYYYNRIVSRCRMFAAAQPLASIFPQPQGHPAHLFFFLSRRIFRIIAVTIPSKTKAIKIVPMPSLPHFSFAGRNNRNKNPAVNTNATTVPIPNWPVNSMPN